MSLRKFANQVRSMSAPELVAEHAAYTRRRFGLDGQPVVIAAHNEQDDLPATLLSLAHSERRILPIVAENGSSDATAHFAHKMGAAVVSLEYASKVAALQAGTELALEHAQQVLYIDADTIAGPMWSQALLKELDKSQDTPMVTYGRATFSHGESAFVDRARGLNNYFKTYHRVMTGNTPVSIGANMAINFADSDTAVSGYLAINPEIFGAEEIAIADVIAMSGGIATQCIDTDATVISRGDRFGTVSQCLRWKLGLITREDTYGDSYYHEYTGDNLFEDNTLKLATRLTS